jgi:hypothetical protein
VLNQGDALLAHATLHDLNDDLATIVASRLR